MSSVIIAWGDVDLECHNVTTKKQGRTYLKRFNSYIHLLSQGAVTSKSVKQNPTTGIKNT